MGSYCDRCGKKGKTTSVGFWETIYQDWDICDVCLEKLKDWLTNE